VDGAVSLCGGTAVHYRCDESADWQPDLEDLAAKVTPRTKAIVVINPNNPTGAVYSQETLSQIVELARRHGLMLFSDEIYDKILYDDATHTCTAALAPDLLCLTFNGLSKAYRVAGFRTGWMVLSGPKKHAPATSRAWRFSPTCAVSQRPTQYAVQTALAGTRASTTSCCRAGRLLDQRDTAWRLLNEIPGVSCVKPRGALYAFPRLDPDVYPIVDDERFVLDLLRSQRILVVQGTGFNWPTPDHFRVVTLPRVTDLEEAIGRIGTFLTTYRQD
jgi:alanine-synthesizing transaminase